jgi:ABC-type transporter Mla subunit MlaD
MTDQERQRQMDFILEQQAQLTVSMGQLTEKVDRLSDKVDRTADSVNALLAIAEIHDQQIKATDERLNALVNVVDRYITGRTGQEGEVK